MPKQASFEDAHRSMCDKVHEDLRLYAILRSDIRMSPGKTIAQAGHAYTDTLINQIGTPSGQAYARLTPGTKICLDGGTEDNLNILYERLVVDRFAPVAIIDHGHIELPDFDGGNVLTAIGLGPIRRADVPRWLRRLPLWNPKF